MTLQDVFSQDVDWFLFATGRLLLYVESRPPSRTHLLRPLLEIGRRSSKMFSPRQLYKLCRHSSHISQQGRGIFFCAAGQGLWKHTNSEYNTNIVSDKEWEKIQIEWGQSKNKMYINTCNTLALMQPRRVHTTPLLTNVREISLHMGKCH
jgi:hypothetical protein